MTPPISPPPRQRRRRQEKTTTNAIENTNGGANPSLATIRGSTPSRSIRVNNTNQTHDDAPNESSIQSRPTRTETLEQNGPLLRPICVAVSLQAILSPIMSPITVTDNDNIPGELLSHQAIFLDTVPNDMDPSLLSKLQLTQIPCIFIKQ